METKFSIDFLSNPPLPPKPVVKADEVNGVIVNKIVYEPNSNRALYDGVHFDRNSMSLRALLNMGVDLHQVSLAQTENDPTRLANLVSRLDSAIEEQVNSLFPESSETAN